MRSDVLPAINGLKKQRWFRSKDAEKFFGISEDEFLSLTQIEGFPPPTRLSQKIKVWERVSCANRLSKNTCNKIAKEFVKEYKKNINQTVVKPPQVFMKKASLARYIGISSSGLQLLIQRADDFPTPMKAFFKTPVYTVLSVNCWLLTRLAV